MTMWLANNSTCSTSTRCVSAATARSKSLAGSPVASRTRMEVSIPQRRGMCLLAEGVDVEGRRVAAQLAPQRRKATRVHALGAQQKAVRAGLQFETVAGLHAQGVQHPCGKRDLSFGRDRDEHG